MTFMTSMSDGFIAALRAMQLRPSTVIARLHFKDLFATIKYTLSKLVCVPSKAIKVRHVGRFFYGEVRSNEETDQMSPEG